MTSPKVIVIGLDSMPGEILFNVMKDKMPSIASLCETGAWGPCVSTDPPVTVPAWVSASTGLDPGELGIYGFRNRIKNSYDFNIVSSNDVHAPTFWEKAALNNLKSVIVSMPLTYPLSQNKNVTITGDFLTPGSDSRWIEPWNKRKIIEQQFGNYIIDVMDYRAKKKESLLKQCTALTRQHFEIFRHLIKDTSCDLAVMVDLGPDRLHHGLLDAILPGHPDFDENNPMVEKCADYYRMLDRQIEKTLNLADSNTTIIIVSDHGVKPLLGSFCVNEWLIKIGYLKLKNKPSDIGPLTSDKVDWKNTKAWGEGGHHCRINFNVAGREPHGVVLPSQLAGEIKKLTSLIKKVETADKKKLSNRVFSPRDEYKTVNGFPPDLIVYWDDLNLRCAGTIGHGELFLTGNDTGDDKANHDFEGIMIINAAWIEQKGYVKNNKLTRLYSLVLNAL